MDDYLEIDVKKIIRTLFAKKFWILGVTLAIGLAVFFFFFRKPDVFEAMAMIALIQPRSEAKFPLIAMVASLIISSIVVLFLSWWKTEDKPLEEIKA